MLEIGRRPLLSKRFDTPDDFRPNPGSVFLYAASFEERSQHPDRWNASDDDVRMVELREEELNMATTSMAGFERLSLRNASHILAFLRAQEGRRLYLDITGLGHRVWAPLVRVAIEEGFELYVVYVEPLDYRPSASLRTLGTFEPAGDSGPAPPPVLEIFELSERIDGIEPLPLFVNLADPSNQDVTFIPILGFEGTRFAYVLHHIEYSDEKVYPVIGVPGFRPEYPFFSYWANERQLLEGTAYQHVHYARANCPFSCFYLLRDMVVQAPDDHIRIGLMGTKPHALGAVMLAVALKARGIELVYDHTRRKPGRTDGSAHLHVYEVSNFMSIQRRDG